MKHIFKILLGILGGIGCLWLTASLDVTSQLKGCYVKQELNFGTTSTRAVDAAKVGIWGYKGTRAQDRQLLHELCPFKGKLLGYAVVTDFQKALSAPMTSSQSFVPFTSLTLRDGTTLAITMLGSQVFFTLEPGATNEEIIVCTAIDATNKQATGCTRGLAFSGTSLSGVAANQKTHSSGATVVMSNVHYVYNNYLDKLTTSTQIVAGPVTYNYFPVVSSTTAVCSTADQLCNKKYIDGLVAVGVAVSSTAGLAFDSGSTLYVNASSTTSTNGGFLSFNGLGQLYWNAPGFIGSAWTWTGSQTFNASTTFAATTTFWAQSVFNVTSTFNADVVLTASPGGGTSIVNQNYVLNTISSNSATGTAAATITAGQAVFITTTSTLVATNSGDATSTFHFVGIAETGGAGGATITYTRPGGKNCYQSGLLPGYFQYLNGTAGQLSSTPGTLFARVAQAITANCVQVMYPKFIRTGTVTINASGNFNVTTGFYPAHIDIRAGSVGVVSNASIASIGDDSNNAIIFYNAAAGLTQNSYQAAAWYLLITPGGTLQSQGTVSAKSAVGFTLNASTYNADGQIQYTAYSE